jgi:hypothetical protein
LGEVGDPLDVFFKAFFEELGGCREGGQLGGFGSGGLLTAAVSLDGGVDSIHVNSVGSPQNRFYFKLMIDWSRLFFAVAFRVGQLRDRQPVGAAVAGTLGRLLVEKWIDSVFRLLSGADNGELVGFWLPRTARVGSLDYQIGC